MENSPPSVRTQDIESALVQIAEIKAARVVADPDGRIAEIHVVALPSKQPKQLVRDIESALMASFGVSVDHRKVSIAQLAPTAADHLQTQRSSVIRPRIRAINASANGLVATASVTLEIDGVEYIGEASGPASQTGRLRQAALAALDALAGYIPDTKIFALEDVAIMQLGRERVAVACLTLVTAHGEQSFTGSALARHNESDSIVRATLDAVNRRMALLTAE